MIIDALHSTFCEDQAVTATAISTNVMKLNTNGIIHGDAAAITRNLGAGNPIPIFAQVTEAFATLTSLTVSLETSAAAGLTSPTVLGASEAIPAASLVAGYRFINLRFLPDAELLEYLGLRFTVGGSNATAGKISAGFVAGGHNSATF